jgi:RHS repeat-associated protein
LVANQSGQTVWRWDQQEPFGNNPADENPSGLGTFDLPLRLPGQYFDKETNLYYNYFRDYDPGIGRYLESDPIGLRGGLNTYVYARTNPLVFTDRLGLTVDDLAAWWPERPTTDQVNKALRDALKKSSVCLNEGEGCEKYHDKVYKLCVGMFANVAAVVCKINSDGLAEACILNPESVRCPKLSCVPPVILTMMDL